MKKIVRFLLAEENNLFENEVRILLNNTGIVYNLTRMGVDEFVAFVVSQQMEQKVSTVDIVLFDYHLAKLDNRIIEFFNMPRSKNSFKLFILNDSTERLPAKEIYSLNASGQLTKPFAVSNSFSSDIFHFLIDLINIRK